MNKLGRRLWDTMIVPISDFRPLLWVLTITAVLYLLDPEGLNVMRVVLYTVLFWMLSLCIRKALMPYRCGGENGEAARVRMKLSHFLRLAIEGNVAAAVVAVGILFFQALIAFSFVIWMR